MCAGGGGGGKGDAGWCCVVRRGVRTTQRTWAESGGRVQEGRAGLSCAAVPPLGTKRRAELVEAQSPFQRPFRPTEKPLGGQIQNSQRSQ